jgi:hypothetical protein
MLQTMRNVVLLCLQALAFSLCLLSAQAQFNYITNNGAITITGYYGPGGSVTVPDTINGLPVTSIGNYAFYSRGSLGIYLTSITIPGSVTSLGVYAFADNYPNLTGLYFLGNAPSHVDAAAFYTVTFGNPNPCNITVYYLPGSTGWGPTLGGGIPPSTNFPGRPTVCWNPRMTRLRLEHEPESQPPATDFAFDITGGSNLVVVLEASEDMAPWSLVRTWTITSDPYHVAGCRPADYPVRFYRLRWP